MADHKHKETRQLAYDCVTMTLHGPIPMETVANLCQGVMDLYDENEKLRDTGMLLPGVPRLGRGVADTIVKVLTQNRDTADSIESHGIDLMDIVKVGQMAEDSIDFAEALKEARSHVVRQEFGRHEQDRADSKAWMAKWGEKLKAMGIL